MGTPRLVAERSCAGSRRQPSSASTASTATSPATLAAPPAHKNLPTPSSPPSLPSPPTISASPACVYDFVVPAKPKICFAGEMNHFRSCAVLFAVSVGFSAQIISDGTKPNAVVPVLVHSRVSLKPCELVQRGSPGDRHGVRMGRNRRREIGNLLARNGSRRLPVAFSSNLRTRR